MNYLSGHSREPPHGSIRYLRDTLTSSESRFSSTIVLIGNIDMARSIETIKSRRTGQYFKRTLY